MKNTLALILGLALYALLSPLFLLAKLGVKWADNFLSEGDEPLDVYGVIK